MGGGGKEKERVECWLKTKNPPPALLLCNPYNSAGMYIYMYMLACSTCTELQISFDKKDGKRGGWRENLISQ